MKRQLSLFAPLFAAILATGCATGLIPSPTATLTLAPTETATLAPSATVLPSETPIPVSKICSPLTDHALIDLHKYVTQPFIPPQGENKETGHHGVDFGYYHRDSVGGPLEGNPIQSVLDGYMAGLGYNPVYGNYLIVETPFEKLPAELASLYPIQPGESLYVLYAHMQDLAPFEIHEPLDCGQQIGRVGKSGRYPDLIAEPHLHIETRVGAADIFIEPMSFYDTRASQAEKDEYLKWRTSDTFKLFDPMILLDFGASLEEIHG
jgi:murein DD-endopeptidase MepM/ murein hydrolase activator NlpD